MCTAVSFVSKNHYFGRNLDYEFSYQEEVVVTPRNFPLTLGVEETINSHYAMIGMALVENRYPLYYDATNEAGLSMAGLNFPGNAVYKSHDPRMINIAPFAFIPWILGQCGCIPEVELCLKKLNLANVHFSKSLSLTPLHWLISDKERSIVVEPRSDGIHVYDNPIGVLTNNPPFDYHMHNIANYLNLTREEPTNRFAPSQQISPYSRGMGAIGLPGDLSSASRFIKAAFTKLNSVCKEDEESSVSQFFHILGSVCQQDGCTKVKNGFEKTLYSSCCNTDTGVYYYRTYENSQLTAVNMHHEDLDSMQLFRYPIRRSLNIQFEN